ncbi:MAG: ribonuclease P protein component [Proteobacteria bacterium]|nr:ribonuclease P protein component [Pseudomonadota bacterium]
MQRLQSRAQFQAVLAGSTVARTPHFALHRCALEVSSHVGDKPAAALFEPAATWLGAMVPKRWARRAVTRNAIKRQIYSVSASFDAALPQAAYVVRLRAGFDRKVFPSASSVALKAAVRTELLQLFQRVGGSRQGAAS